MSLPSQEGQISFSIPGPPLTETPQGPGASSPGSPALHCTSLPGVLTTPQQGWEEAPEAAWDLTRPVLLKLIRGDLSFGWAGAGETERNLWRGEGQESTPPTPGDRHRSKS